MIGQILTALQSHWLFVLVFVIVVYFTQTHYRPGLHSIPGPWLASLTDVWRAYAIYCGRFDLTNRRLHEKYGKVVRIGPNCVSVGDPHDVPKIYSIQRPFPKSSYYEVAKAYVNGQNVGGVFQAQDEETHKTLRRPIAHAFAMTTLIDYEPLVNSTTTVLADRLTDLFATTGEVCPFDRWLHWYAFDVIGEVTFSRRLGFLEQGEDAGGTISILRDANWYATVIGQIPWLDPILDKNWLRYKLFPPRKARLPLFVMNVMKSRLEEVTKTDAVAIDKPERPQKDFLSKYTEAAENYGGKIPPQQLIGWAMANINAGADTTAIALKAIFYFLLRNPRTMEKLLAELDSANLPEMPTHQDTNSLPYLTAVIKEALRLHGPAGVLLERVVPEGGVEVAGHMIPEGTIIGCNPSVIHHDKEVYGKQYDVNQFWPERFLDADEATKSEMERFSIVFGAGTRSCIGRNISMLEIYKVVPVLLKRFKITLANPEKEWKIWDTFFIHQKDIDVYLEPRSDIMAKPER